MAGKADSDISVASLLFCDHNEWLAFTDLNKCITKYRHISEAISKARLFANFSRKKKNHHLLIAQEATSSNSLSRCHICTEHFSRATSLVAGTFTHALDCDILTFS